MTLILSRYLIDGTSSDAIRKELEIRKEIREKNSK
jgi:hypothetical protein